MDALRHGPFAGNRLIGRQEMHANIPGVFLFLYFEEMYMSISYHRFDGRLSIDASDLNSFQGGTARGGIDSFLLGKSFENSFHFPTCGLGLYGTGIFAISISIFPPAYGVYRVRFSLRSTQPTVGRDVRSQWGR